MTTAAKPRPRLLVEIGGEPFTAKLVPDPNGLAWRLMAPDGAVFRLREEFYGPICLHPDGREHYACPHGKSLQALGLLNPPCASLFAATPTPRRRPVLPLPCAPSRPPMSRPTLTRRVIRRAFDGFKALQPPRCFA